MQKNSEKYLQGFTNVVNWPTNDQNTQVWERANAKQICFLNTEKVVLNCQRTGLKKPSG